MTDTELKSRKNEIKSLKRKKRIRMFYEISLIKSFVEKVFFAFNEDDKTQKSEAKIVKIKQKTKK